MFSLLCVVSKTPDKLLVLLVGKQKIKLCARLHQYKYVGDDRGSFPGGKLKHRLQCDFKQALMFLSTPSLSQTQPRVQSIPVIPWEPCVPLLLSLFLIWLQMDSLGARLTADPDPSFEEIV